MGIEDNFLISPIALKGLHKYSLKICELFWDVKMEICIFGKTQEINIHKTVSRFTQQLPKTISHNIIQRLSCVMGYFDVNKKEKSVELIGL